MSFIVVVCGLVFGGCLEETDDFADLSASGGMAGSGGEAGSGGSETGGTETGGTGATGGTGGMAGAGGTGSKAPECEPEGAMRDCKCPDGASGTQKCVDGKYEQCVCEYFPDADGDGYGDAEANPVTGTNPPSGHVGNNDDCDDGDASVHPGATEVCDGKDNNCNGQVDEGGVCGTSQTWYEDADGDSYGNPNRTKVSVQKPDGYVSIAGDCDDGDASVHPGATEVCDGKDNNCDGQIDEGGVCGTASTNVTLKYEVDCEAQTWAQSPQPEGSWAGRAYGPLTGCVSTGRKTACTFDVPAPDYPTFVGQGSVGFGRYAGDGSGNAPAPCVTPTQVDAMEGHAITLLCTVRLWKDGVPVKQRWESNGVMKPSGTQSCEASGSFPYYNSRPVVE